MYAVEQLRALTGADAEDWARLSDGPAFHMSPTWLRYCEARESGVTRYLAIRDEADRIAAASAYIEPGGDPLDIAADVTRGEADQGFGPVLPAAATYGILGSSRGYRSSVLVAPDPQAPRRLASLVAGAAERCCEGTRDLLIAPHLPREQAERIASRQPDASVVFAGADCTLMVPPDGLDGYLRGLPGKARRNARREQRSFADSGLLGGVERLTATLADEAAPLIAEHEQRYGIMESVDEARRSLQHQIDHLAEHAVTFTAREDGTLRALVLAYRWREWLYERLFGAADDQRGFAYFNLVFYEAMKFAAARGLRMLHVGRGSYQAKRHRGGKAEALFHVVWGERELRSEWQEAGRVEELEARRLLLAL